MTDDELADEFRTPQLPRNPRYGGPKLLGFDTKSCPFVAEELETLIDFRFAHDPEDVVALFERDPEWLAVVLGLSAPRELEVLAAAREVRRRDSEIPILIEARGTLDAALTRTAVELDASLIVDDGASGPAVVAFLQRAIKRRGRPEDRLVRLLTEVYELSIMEARVTRLTLAGEPRATIAAMLFISPHTFDTHAARIRKKTGRTLKSLRGRDVAQLIEELMAKLEKAAKRSGT